MNEVINPNFEYEMATKDDPTPEGDRSADLQHEEKSFVPLDIERVLSLEHLRMISQASGGFTFAADPRLEQEFWATGVLKSGYTNLHTRVIYYNPIHAKGVTKAQIVETFVSAGKPVDTSKVRGIPPWTAKEARGFFYHEAGHHAPEVIGLQDKMTNNMRAVPIPKEFQGNPKLEKKFYGVLHSNVNNAVADVWDEAFMGRKPYNLIAKDIKDLNTPDESIETYKNMAVPMQFLQAVLRERFTPDTDLETKMDPEAFKSVCRVIDSGALKALMDWRAFGYLAMESNKEKAIERKFTAYKDYFLDEYLRLMKIELEQRKEEKEKGEEGRKPTPEEIEQMIKDILDELEEAGKEFGSQAKSDEEKSKEKAAMDQLSDRIDARHSNKNEDFKPEQDESVHDRMRDRMKELLRQQSERDKKRMAEKMGVTPETVGKWRKIHEKYPAEIESTASVLSEIFLDNRRKRWEYLKRSGEVVPGLEAEYVGAILSGDLDPDTKMELINNPQFLQTQLEIIHDTSGSMATDKRLEKSVETTVIITEAFKRVLSDLDAEGLVMQDEHPFQIGVTGYSTISTRITKLEEPLSDAKELKIMQGLAEARDGTDETGAFTEIHESLKLGEPNAIKIIIVFTDGQGNREKVAPIMRQIERDDQVVFLVVGFGNDAEDSQNIVDSYLAPLNDKNKNVFGFASPNPADSLRFTLDFLKREVDKRRT
jgi:hypothetical protein